MSIFIISNRAVDNNNRFETSGKEKALPTFRVAKIRDPEAKKLDYDLFDDKFPNNYENVIEKIRDSKGDIKLKGSEQMFFELYQDNITSNGGKNGFVKNDILFFIHGFSTGFEASLKHIKKLHDLYIKPKESPVKHMIYLSWPSKNSKIFTYWSDQDDARKTGVVLSRVFEKTHEFFHDIFDMAAMEHCMARIHLMCHSMGNQVLETFMKSIAGDNFLPIVTEVFLLHADVKNTVFEEGQPFYYLKDLSRRTHIYIHNGDDALRISRFTKNGNKRLGQRGPADLSDLNDETFIVDVTSNKDSVSTMEGIVDHWGYLEREDEINDILQVLKGTNEYRIKTRSVDQHQRKNYFIIEETP